MKINIHFAKDDGGYEKIKEKMGCLHAQSIQNYIESIDKNSQKVVYAYIDKMIDEYERTKKNLSLKEQVR